jgi:hypothetical protein
MGYRTKCFDAHGDSCVACGDDADVAHHVNTDRTDNRVENLAPLCYSCHMKIHSGNAVAYGWEEQTPGLAPQGVLSSSDDTTVTISSWTKDELDEYRAEGVTWSEYMLWLLKRAVDESDVTPGSTSFTIEEGTHERLRAYRTDGHYSWNDCLNDILDTIPPEDKLREGCEHCGERVLLENRRGESQMVVQSFSVDEAGETFHLTRLFCSADCAAEAHKKVQAMVPEDPDKIIVGGADMPRASTEMGTFYIDGETQEVGIPLPGAYSGTDAGGNEYDYVGEPVYVHNDGRVVQSGVIEDIIHEEAHTALLLGHDHDTVMQHHPEEEKRREYAERGGEQ